MSKEVLYLGLDVHAENIAVAIAEAGRDGFWRKMNRKEMLCKTIKARIIEEGA